MPMLEQAAGGQPAAPQPGPAPGGPAPGGAPAGAPPGGAAPGGAPGGAPPPVAPPAPGAGQADLTTVAGQSDPNNMAPATSTAGVVGQMRSGQQTSNIGAGEEEASPEEQKEYEKAIDALHQILYEDEERTEGVLQMLNPEDKIGTTVKTTIMLLKQMDERLDLNENIVAELTVDIADRLIELGETAHDMSFSEKETQAVAGAAWEGVLQLFGIDEESMSQMTQGMGEEQLAGYEKEYKGFLEGATNG